MKSILLDCLVCGTAVQLKRRIVWPWLRLRGMTVRFLGCCPSCHTEATINGYKRKR